MPLIASSLESLASGPERNQPGSCLTAAGASRVADVIPATVSQSADPVVAVMLEALPYQLHLRPGIHLCFLCPATKLATTLLPRVVMSHWLRSKKAASEVLKTGGR